MKTFPITAQIDGRMVAVPGWMMVISLARAGVPWAQEQMSRPEFGARVREALEAKAKKESEEELLDLCEAKLRRLEAWARSHDSPRHPVTD